MHNLDSAKVLVVGDIMLDNYWVGDTSRISPEAPVPVVHVKSNMLRQAVQATSHSTSLL
jgi:D-beta-D-heptose 7-phosphate kinase/D-beta-D-heptose 1-phosphate adenosyltransferase